MHAYWVTRNQESKENHGFELLYYIHKKERATMTTSDLIHPKPPPPFCRGCHTQSGFVSCDGDAILIRCRRENFPEKTLSAAVMKNGRQNT